MKKDKILKCAVTSKLEEEVRAYCEKQDITISEFLRLAIDFYLKKENCND